MSPTEPPIEGSVDDEIQDYLQVLLTNLKKINAEIGGEPIDLEDDEDLAIYSQEIEEQFSVWISWFYSTIVYLLLINVCFFISVVDNTFQFLPFVLVLLFPFYMWYAFLNSIPEIKVNDEVVFSRETLTFRRQIQLGRALFRYFSKELVKNSPIGVTIVSLAMVLLGIVTINTYLIS